MTATAPDSNASAPVIDAADQSERKGTTATVERALQLLTALGSASRPPNLTQLADSTSLSKSTVFRLLNTLRDAGMVTREGTSYALGDKLVELAGKAPEPILLQARDTLRETAMPFLQTLFTQTGCTVHLAVLDRGRVLYLEKLFGHRRVPTPSRVGGSFAANASGIGKALLAWSDEETIDSALEYAEAPTRDAITSPEKMYRELARIRKYGWAEDNGESATHLRCVAAPIHNNLGITAALSISRDAATARPEHQLLTLRAALSVERALAAVAVARAV